MPQYLKIYILILVSNNDSRGPYTSANCKQSYIQSEARLDCFVPQWCEKHARRAADRPVNPATQEYSIVPVSQLIYKTIIRSTPKACR